LASFTILGSSSGMPHPHRACSGYVLQVGESLNLIDCGGGVASSFLRCGFDPLKLDRIFISHTHSDHVAELTLFIQMLHVLEAGRRLAVYVPDEFVDRFEDYLEAVYLFGPRLRLDLEIHGYGDGLVIDEGFRLIAIANSHIAKLAPYLRENNLRNKMQCYSFKIEVNDRSLLYSADIGSFDDIRGCLDGLDYALVETTHVDVGEIIEHARTSTVKQYILTHLGNDDEAAGIDKRVRAAGITNMLLAADGMRLDL